MNRMQFLLDEMSQALNQLAADAGWFKRNINAHAFQQDFHKINAPSYLSACIKLLNAEFNFCFVADLEAIRLKEEKVNRFARYAQQLDLGIRRFDLLMDKVAEEAAEAAIRCLKAKHYGLLEIQSDQHLTNIERLHNELNDVAAAFTMINRECQFGFEENANQVQLHTDQIGYRALCHGAFSTDKHLEAMQRLSIAEFWTVHSDEMSAAVARQNAAVIELHNAGITAPLTGTIGEIAPMYACHMRHDEGLKAISTGSTIADVAPLYGDNMGHDQK